MTAWQKVKFRGKVEFPTFKDLYIYDAQSDKYWDVRLAMDITQLIDFYCKIGEGFVEAFDELLKTLPPDDLVSVPIDNYQDFFEIVMNSPPSTGRSFGSKCYDFLKELHETKAKWEWEENPYYKKQNLTGTTWFRKEMIESLNSDLFNLMHRVKYAYDWADQPIYYNRMVNQILYESNNIELDSEVEVKNGYFSNGCERIFYQPRYNIHGFSDCCDEDW